MRKPTNMEGDLPSQEKDWRKDDGWRRFHDRHAGAILDHAMRSGLSREEAEDVVNTTITNAAACLPGYEYDRTISRYGKWLNQTINQRILEIRHYRRKARAPETSWQPLIERISGGVNPTTDPVAQLELEQRLLETCLARICAEARPQQWQIFEARVLQGLDGSTVARRFCTSRLEVWYAKFHLTNLLRREWRLLLNRPLKA
ncbi:MAG: sigma-70 family RNA polymerase sigma factor [Verrucomicrobia bacterium]|nr:sigma-70 family RNA polymerase sigma factor [Verrucomicrobiota bacterium]